MQCFLLSHKNNLLVSHIADLHTKFHFHSVYYIIMIVVFKKKSAWIGNLFHIWHFIFNERHWNRPKSVFSLKSYNSERLYYVDGICAFHCLWVTLFLFYYSERCRKWRAMQISFSIVVQINLSVGGTIDQPLIPKKKI